jgi:hypothetical protein
LIIKKYYYTKQKEDLNKQTTTPAIAIAIAIAEPIDHRLTGLSEVFVTTFIAI